MTLFSLKSIEERLPKDSCFMRVHRSFIVNLKKITESSSESYCFQQKPVCLLEINMKRFPEFLNQFSEVVWYVAYRAKFASEPYFCLFLLF